MTPLHNFLDGRPKLAHALYDLVKLSTLVALGGCGLYFLRSGPVSVGFLLMVLGVINFEFIDLVLLRAMRSRQSQPPPDPPQ